MGNTSSSQAGWGLHASPLGASNNSYWVKRRKEDSWKLREALLDGDVEAACRLLDIDTAKYSDLLGYSNQIPKVSGSNGEHAQGISHGSAAKNGASEDEEEKGARDRGCFCIFRKNKSASRGSADISASKDACPQVPPPQTANTILPTTKIVAQSLPASCGLLDLSVHRWMDDGGHSAMHYLARGRCETEYAGMQTNYPVVFPVSVAPPGSGPEALRQRLLKKPTDQRKLRQREPAIESAQLRKRLLLIFLSEGRISRHGVLFSTNDYGATPLHVAAAVGDLILIDTMLFSDSSSTPELSSAFEKALLSADSDNLMPIDVAAKFERQAAARCLGLGLVSNIADVIATHRSLLEYRRICTNSPETTDTQQDKERNATKITKTDTGLVGESNGVGRETVVPEQGLPLSNLPLNSFFLSSVNGNQMLVDIEISVNNVRNSAITYLRSWISTENGEDDREGNARNWLEQFEEGELGLKWKEAGSDKPSTGTEIQNELLAAALQKKIEFKKEEWEKFQVANLSSDSYVKAGNRYFKPAYLGGGCEKDGCESFLSVQEIDGCEHFSPVHKPLEEAGHHLRVVSPLPEREVEREMPGEEEGKFSKHKLSAGTDTDNTSRSCRTDEHEEQLWGDTEQGEREDNAGDLTTCTTPSLFFGPKLPKTVQIPCSSKLSANVEEQSLSESVIRPVNLGESPPQSETHENGTHLPTFSSQNADESEGPQLPSGPVSSGSQSAATHLLNVRDQVSAKVREIHDALSGRMSQLPFVSSPIVDGTESQKDRLVEMNLRLNMDFQAAGQEDSIQRRIFIKDLKQDLADASGTGASNFNILKVSPGSVLLDLNAPEKAAQAIYRQSLNPNSRLRSGKVTRFTDNIILSDKITLPRPARLRPKQTILKLQNSSPFEGDEDLQNSKDNAKPVVLQLRVLSLENLPKMDGILSGGKADPFVVIEYADQAYKTSVRKNALRAEYQDEIFTFEVRPCGVNIAADVKAPEMVFTVLDWDKCGTNKLIGTCAVSGDVIWSIAEGRAGKVYTKSENLLDAEGNRVKNDKEALSEITMEFQVTKEATRSMPPSPSEAPDVFLVLGQSPRQSRSCSLEASESKPSVLTTLAEEEEDIRKQLQQIHKAARLKADYLEAQMHQLEACKHKSPNQPQKGAVTPAQNGAGEDEDEPYSDDSTTAIQLEKRKERIEKKNSPGKAGPLSARNSREKPGPLSARNSREKARSSREKPGPLSASTFSSRDFLKEVQQALEQTPSSRQQTPRSSIVESVDYVKNRLAELKAERVQREALVSE